MSNKPIKKYSAGAVSASVWENENEKDGKKYSFQTVSLERCYKDKDSNWQNTSSLRVADLPKAMLVLQKAYEFLAMSREHDGNVVAEEVVE